MKKAYKALSVLMVVVMIAFTCTNVFAAINVDSISASADTAADDTILEIGNTVLSIVTNVGMILAVIIVAVIGVKYMMESSEGKAEYKKNMIPYLVGAVLVFGASAIGKAVIQFGKDIAE